MQESVKMANSIHGIEKKMRKQVRNINAKYQEYENVSEGSTRHSTELEEKVDVFTQGLVEVSDLHPSSSQLFTLIKDGVEDCLQRLLSREKFKNICLQDSSKKVQQELTKEQVEREALECQYTEMKERVKQIKKVEQEHSELQQQLKQLEQEHQT